MSTKLETQLGHACPPATNHSITTHLPGWAFIEKFVENPGAVVPTLKSMYPRMLPLLDVRNLTGVVLRQANTSGQACLLFSSIQSALECQHFATTVPPATSGGQGSSGKAEPLKVDEVSIRAFEFQQVLFAVFFPADKMLQVMPFWVHPGVGISTRLAEDNLKFAENIREVSTDVAASSQRFRSGFESSSHATIRDRIAGLLARAPVSDRPAKAESSDVYLFPTGMATIHRTHQYLQQHYRSEPRKSILFGFAFHSTIHVFEDFGGPENKFMGLGSEEDIDELEVYLNSEAESGRFIQAVWTEFPSNPALVTPNLPRLKQLADKYDFVLAVDDTIGSFANVDVLDYADVVVTSLTKSFSGYADVMAGSVVLNPNSPRYHNLLKPLFEKEYTPEFYEGDAEVLERNSRNYLARSTILNRNAQALVTYLESESLDPDSPVAAVHYPTSSYSRNVSSRLYYDKCRRPSTQDKDFPESGYGCLLSMTFRTIDHIKKFYDNINIHLGPHLGAHLTIGIPYVFALYGKSELEEVAKYDLKPTLMRISVGLEEEDKLLQVFKSAIDSARDVPVNGKHEQ